jgi:hypothetical protein
MMINKQEDISIEGKYLNNVPRISMLLDEMVPGSSAGGASVGRLEPS